MQATRVRIAIAALICAMDVTRTTPAHARGSANLFSIVRNTNANIVKYDAQRAGDGQLNLVQPLTAYWVMLAEDGRREELTWLEREFAYGFSVSAASPAGFILRLAAFKQREIRVDCTSIDCRARVRIASSVATLKQIYVAADGGVPMPHVRYIELRGVADDGARVVERIKAH